MRVIDTNKKLKDYLKRNLTKGYTETSLKMALEYQGYSRAAVDRAIEQIHKELAFAAPELKEKPKITHQIIDEYDKPIEIRKSFLKRIFG